jgi:hypothetical protein
MSKTAQNMDRYRVGNPSVLRRCAALGPFLACLLAGGAQAGAWEEFQARCLSPYENLAPAVFDDLEKVVPSEPRVAVSRFGAYFALTDGAVLASDPAPLGTGVRLCAVHGMAHPPGAKAWAAKQLAQKLYELEEHNDDGSFALLSNLWIEPKLNVSVAFKQGGDYVVYQIVETDLES